MGNQRLDHLLSKETGRKAKVKVGVKSSSGTMEFNYRCPTPTRNSHSNSLAQTFTVFSTACFQKHSFFENRKLEIKENYNVSRFNKFILLSVYGRTMDALASGGYEGRNRLR